MPPNFSKAIDYSWKYWLTVKHWCLRDKKWCALSKIGELESKFNGNDCIVNLKETKFEEETDTQN